MRRRCAPHPDAFKRAMAKRRKPKAKAAAPSRRPLLVPRHRATPRASEPLDLARCERFLLHEARLLDEGKFDAWLALFPLMPGIGCRASRIRTTRTTRCR